MEMFNKNGNEKTLYIFKNFKPQTILNF